MYNIVQLCDLSKNLICVTNYTEPDGSKNETTQTCSPDGFPEGKEKRYCEVVAKVVGLEGDPKIKVEAPTVEGAKKEAEEKKKMMKKRAFQERKNGTKKSGEESSLTSQQPIKLCLVVAVWLVSPSY